MEEPVGVVELAGLEGEELRGEGLQSQQVVEDEGRGGVVGPVVERGDLESGRAFVGGTQWNHSFSRSLGYHILSPTGLYASLLNY